MVMRYHWGLGVGHTYAHKKTMAPPNTEGNGLGDNSSEEEGAHSHETSLSVSPNPAVEESRSRSPPDSSDEDSWSHGGEDSGEDLDDHVHWDSDLEELAEEILGMDDMYGGAE